MAELTLPNREKIPTPIQQLDAQDLGWWRKRLTEDLDKDPDGRYAANNRKKLEAVNAEIARRVGGGAQAAAPAAAAPSTALARAPSTGSIAIAGSHARADELAAALVAAERQFHLVSPATQCGNLPEGCEVVISMVSVDARLGRDGKPLTSDIYPVGAGKFGLGKAPLDRIAGAAGIDWDPVLTRRLDDGRDAHYVAFQAVGVVRSFDGTRRTITGTKEMDLRDNSPQCEALAARKRDGSDDASKQIREMRLHILGHAETKAKLRAIRSLGIQTSYSVEEFAKPWAVARLMFTGRTNDPELRREFARMNAEAFIGGTRALYGAPVMPALPPPVSAPRGSYALDEDDFAPEPPRQITSYAEEVPPPVTPASVPQGQPVGEPVGVPVGAPAQAGAQKAPSNALPPDQDRGADPNAY